MSANTVEANLIYRGVYITEGPLLLRQRIKAYFGVVSELRTIFRFVRTAEPREKRAGKGELGEMVLRV